MSYNMGYCVCEHATDQAILVKTDDEEEGIWIPQSQIADESEVWKIGDTGNLIVTEWFAKKKGWL